MLLPEQKLFALMQYLVRKFGLPGGMVVDPCLGTGATAKACLLEPKHRKFTGCKVDSACIPKIMTSVLEIFTVRMLNERSSIKEGKKAEKVAAAYLLAATVPYGVGQRSVWVAPKGVSVVQVFPHHTTLYLSQYFFGMQLFQTAKHLPCSLCYQKRLSCLSFLDEKTVSTHE